MDRQEDRQTDQPAKAEKGDKKNGQYQMQREKKQQLEFPQQ